MSRSSLDWLSKFLNSRRSLGLLGCLTDVEGFRIELYMVHSVTHDWLRQLTHSVVCVCVGGRVCRDSLPTLNLVWRPVNKATISQCREHAQVEPVAGDSIFGSHADLPDNISTGAVPVCQFLGFGEV